MAKSAGEKIIDGLEEFVGVLKSGEKIQDKFTCHKIALKLQPHAYDPDLVKTTRHLMGASQAVFAQFLGVSVKTVSAWEQGINIPQDVACRLMDEIRYNPEYWRKRLRDLAVSKGAGRKKSTRA